MFHVYSTYMGVSWRESTEREAVYKLGLKFTSVGRGGIRVNRTSSKKKQQKKQKLLNCWMFKYKGTTIQLLFLELVEVDSRSVAVTRVIRQLHQLTMACSKCTHHKRRCFSGHRRTPSPHRDELYDVSLHRGSRFCIS